MAPPGGGSSNIFGVDSASPTNQPAKSQPPVRTQENILGQPQQPQQRGSDRNIRGAPRQGERSFTTLFGPGHSHNDNDKLASPSKGSNNTASVLDKPECRTPNSARMNSARKNQDTFKNVYGDPNIKVEANTPKVHRNKDSFSRVFSGEPVSPKQVKLYKGIESLSLSDRNEKRPESSGTSNKHNTLATSFNRVFGEYQGDSKPSHIKHMSDPSAFNPITGEPYGPSPVKADANAPSDENETKDKEETENQNGSGVDVSSSDTTAQQQLKPIPAGEPQERPSTRVMAPPGGRSTKLW